MQLLSAHSGGLIKSTFYLLTQILFCLLSKSALSIVVSALCGCGHVRCTGDWSYNTPTPHKRDSTLRSSELLCVSLPRGLGLYFSRSQITLPQLYWICIKRINDEFWCCFRCCCRLLERCFSAAKNGAGRSWDEWPEPHSTSSSTVSLVFLLVSKLGEAVTSYY